MCAFGEVVCVCADIRESARVLRRLCVGLGERREVLNAQETVFLLGFPHCPK